MGVVMCKYYERSRNKFRYLILYNCTAYGSGWVTETVSEYIVRSEMRTVMEYYMWEPSICLPTYLSTNLLTLSTHHPPTHPPILPT